ncbi:MAG: hypothetical protein B6I20_11275 [Bacteroidetes bacterium 4572_117]|nr:MAG: hypothetical protein B6I20_11275 [Bacteroidetes bacterium 4572_117]
MNIRIKLLLFTLSVFFFGCTEKNENATEKPNIVLIMADDMGYSDLGCYGSEISTPNIDKLAFEGIRFNRFYNNSRCCPTRASLLTGLYPHNAGVGNMTTAPGKECAKGPFQGYLSREAVTIAEALKSAGYNSYLSGKWHVGEGAENWPMQRGFNRYFGLISGASSYFELIKNQKHRRQMALDSTNWEPPTEGFYMTDAITDHAIEYIKNKNNEEKPFFLYVAYTAPHWPLHALPDDIAKYNGRYDIGWDTIRLRRYNKLKDLGLIDENTKLSERPDDIPSWESIENKADWADKMEVYAAMIDRMDHGVGKIMKELKKQGKLENTLVIFLSDNGASRENVEKRGLNNPDVPVGLQGSYVSYQAPWANVSNTPYRYYKKSTYEGGLASPFIAHWPKKIKTPGVIINQLAHVYDFMPTFLDIAKSNYPNEFNSNTIQPTDGISILDVLLNNQAISRGAMCWEHVGNVACREGDWKLVKHSYGDWNLYNLKEDGSEINNLADTYPDKVKDLKQKYNIWAKKTGIKLQD